MRSYFWLHENEFVSLAHSVGMHQSDMMKTYHFFHNEFFHFLYPTTPSSSFLRRQLHRTAGKGDNASWGRGGLLLRPSLDPAVVPPSLLLLLLVVLLLLLTPATTGLPVTKDFGGDFTAASVSGSDAPGPNAGSMGGKAASAMAIGTGGSGTGNYAENFKTPNYTQYTNQDFKGTTTRMHTKITRALIDRHPRTHKILSQTLCHHLF